MRAKDVLGQSGEDRAVGFLDAMAMRIVERTWRYPERGIEIVALLHGLASAWCRGEELRMPLPRVEHLEGVG